jgi:hypothetical protein
LNRGQPDARNLLAVIHAENGETSLAWSELVHEAPDYQPASANLVILGNQTAVANGETAAVALPPSAAVRAITDKGELNVPIDDAPPIPSAER